MYFAWDDDPNAVTQPSVQQSWITCECGSWTKHGKDITDQMHAHYCPRRKLYDEQNPIKKGT